jgi:hypothetical protein
MSQDVIYLSEIRIERIKGPQRKAYLPMLTEPIWFGLHSEVAEHYRMDPDLYEPFATTLDYLVASAAG